MIFQSQGPYLNYICMVLSSTSFSSVRIQVWMSLGLGTILLTTPIDRPEQTGWKLKYL